MATATFPCHYALIRDAILHKRQVHATYEGHFRKMCPHLLGRDKRGEWVARVYQFGGTTARGLGPIGSPGNWRYVRLKDLKDVTLHDGAWYTGPQMRRTQSQICQVEIQISEQSPATPPPPASAPRHSLHF